MKRFPFFLYNAVLWIFSPLIALYFLVRLWRRGRRLTGLGERMGRVPVLPETGAEGRLWIHAVSVGEVGAAAALLPELQKRFPRLRVVVSTVTETGRETASRLSGVEALFYLPLDYPFAIRRTLERIRPTALVLVETELWPNLIREASRRGIPAAVVNGRITARSFARYMRLKFLFAPVMGALCGAAVREAADADRFEALGLRNVAVTGNLKYDSRPPACSEGRDAVRRRFALSGWDPVIVAGSTHAGEEAAVGRAVAGLRKDFPRLGLLLAPRHLDRLDEAEAALRDAGLEPVRWSRRHAAEGAPLPGGTVLLDVMGVLAEAYGCATVAFIGGSLVPHGGQNPVEAAAWRVPLVYGPHMTNFQEMAKGLEDAGAAIRLLGADALGGAFARWLADPAAGEAAGAAAQAAVEAHRGAAWKGADFLEAALGLSAEHGR